MIILYLGVVFSYTNAWTCGETNVISQSRLKVVNENLIWGKKSLHLLSQEKERYQHAPSPVRSLDSQLVWLR